MKGGGALGVRTASGRRDSPAARRLLLEELLQLSSARGSSVCRTPMVLPRVSRMEAVSLNSDFPDCHPAIDVGSHFSGYPSSRHLSGTIA